MRGGESLLTAFAAGQQASRNAALRIHSILAALTLYARPNCCSVWHLNLLQMGSIVAERELRLRQAMRTMGMLDSAFWLSWASFEVVLVSR